MAGRVQADLNAIIIDRLTKRGLSWQEARKVAAMPEVQKIAKDNYERGVPVPSKFTSMGEKDIAEFRKAPDFTQAVGQKLFWNGQPSREAYQASQTKPPIGFASAPPSSGRWPDLAGQPNALNTPSQSGFQDASWFTPMPKLASGESPLFSSIRAAEGTSDAKAKAHGFASGYDVPLGFGKYGTPPKPLTDMTLREAYDFGNQIRKHPSNPDNSSAIGGLQITGRTMKDFMGPAGLSWDDKFSAVNQQKLGAEIAKAQGTGAWEGFKSHPGELAAARSAIKAGALNYPIQSSSMFSGDMQMRPPIPPDQMGVTEQILSTFGGPLPPSPAVAATTAPPPAATPVNLPSTPLTPHITATGQVGDPRSPSFMQAPAFAKVGFPAPPPAGMGLPSRNPSMNPGMPLRRPIPPMPAPGMNPGLPLRRPPTPMMSPPGTSMMGAMGRPTFPNQGLAGGVNNLFSMAQPIGGMNRQPIPSGTSMMNTSGYGTRFPGNPGGAADMFRMAQPMSPASGGMAPSAPGMAAYGMSPHSGVPGAASAAPLGASGITSRVNAGIAAAGQAAASLDNSAGNQSSVDLARTLANLAAAQQKSRETTAQIHANTEALGARTAARAAQYMRPPPMRPMPFRRPVQMPQAPFRPYGW